MKLKTPSASNAPLKPVYFIDRNLGRRFAESLRAAGLEVRWHDDHFDQDTPDEVWISKVAEDGWIILTHDAMIRYTSRIRDSIADSGARVFLIATKTLRSEQYMKLFHDTRHKIERFIARHQPPYIAKLKRDPHDLAKPGTVELWYPVK